MGVGRISGQGALGRLEGQGGQGDKEKSPTHVFDRLSQAESSDSAKGLGLGLAIARHLSELHNGTIHAESSGAGLGATFIVNLPTLPE